MIKLNNRGFTLVELLAVVVILVIIMLIAIPNINSSIERSNDKKDKAMEKVFRSEGELYVSKYKASISVSDSNKCYIGVNHLVDEGYLNNEDVEDYVNSCLIYDGVNFTFFKNGLVSGKCDDIDRECYS